MQGVWRHGRQRSSCKECASAFIGRTVAKQTVGDGVCEGTVVSFTTSGGCKYSIQYRDGTTATLTKTTLKKILLPPPDASTAAETAAAALIGRTAVADGMPTAAETDTEAPPEDGTAVATKPHAAAAAALDEAAATDGTVTQAAVQHVRTNQSHTMHEDPSAASSQFSDGQLVWAKCGMNPHWPARISGVLNEQSVEVEFFPDETAGFAEAHPSHIVSWMGGFEKYSKLECNSPFRRAIEAASAAWDEESRDSLLI